LFDFFDLQMNKWMNIGGYLLKSFTAKKNDIFKHKIINLRLK